MALLLVRRGIVRVRPLLGGLDAWRGLGLPLADWSGDVTPAVIP